MCRQVGPTGTRSSRTPDLEMWIRIASLSHRCARGPPAPLPPRSRELIRALSPFPHGASRVFQIIDAELADLGRTVVTPEAVTAHEAHRNVDAVLRAVNHYILGDLGGTRRAPRGAASGSRRQLCDPAGTNDRSRARRSRAHTAATQHARGTAVRAPLAPRSARRASRLMRCRWGHLHGPSIARSSPRCATA